MVDMTSDTPGESVAIAGPINTEEDNLTVLSDKPHLPVWAIIIVIIVILILILGMTYCLCKKWIKKKLGKDKKKANGFMKGFVDFQSTALLGQPLNKQQIQPELQNIDCCLNDESCLDVEEEETNLQEAAERKVAENLGRLHYTLEHDFEKEQLTVGIISATDLAAMDMTGTSDPYVKVYFQNEKKKKKETKVHRKTLNPVFNEKFELQLTYAESHEKILIMSVFDHDKLSKHDLIGQVIIPLNTIDLCQIVDETRGLSRPIKDHKKTLGELCLALRYKECTKCDKLTVTVMEAKNLKKMDFGGLSDPYVKLKLILNGKKLKTCTTTVKKFTLTPYYNETFKFDIPSNQIEKVELDVTVIDHDKFGGNDSIGRVSLGSMSTGPALKHWNEMLMSDRRGVVQWHTLQEKHSKR